MKVNNIFRSFYFGIGSCVLGFTSIHVFFFHVGTVAITVSKAVSKGFELIHRQA